MKARASVAAAAFLFALSARAEDKAACIAASEQGQKLVDDRRLLDARKKFLECAEESCPPAVRSDCASQVEQLKKTIPTLVFRVKGDTGDLTKADVFLDGVQISSTLDGQLVAVDPGAHKVRVVVGEGKPLEQELVVAPGEQNRTVVFDVSTKPAAATSPPPAEAPKPETHWSTVRTVGFVSMIVGGTAMLTGVVAELLALVFQSNAATLQSRANGAGGYSCTFGMPTPTGSSDCDSAISYHEQAVATQNVAIGTFIGGGVALIGGIVMYIAGGNVQSTPKAAVHLVPMLGPGVAGLGLGGTF